MEIRNLTPVEYSAQRVLTTAQLAQIYECNEMQIKQNFNNNKGYFTEGKHYFKLEGESLCLFKDRVENFDPVGKNANILYLWTREGAVRHCKMLNTVKAWEMFNELEESYFNNIKIEQKPAEPRIIKFADIVDDIGATRDSIMRVFAVKDGIALAQSTTLIEKFYGQDLSSLKKLIPPAEHEVGYLNATQVGEKIGKTARMANAILKEKGLQVREGSTWRLTDEGKKYAEEYPYSRNGHSDYQSGVGKNN